MAKKTPESKEDAAARRQRELAALTSGVAAFSLMGEAPVVAPAPVEAPAAPVPAATTAAPAAPQPASSEPEGKKVGAQASAAPAVVKVATKAAVPANRAGEEPASPSAVTTSAASPPAEEDDEEVDSEEDDALPETPAVAETSELDLNRLFVPSSEKKGTTLRITADHQQFFTNLGFLLGNGASAPDIIHNILNRFRADHEAQIQKAMKKQMRQMMAPKK
ncbi:hypothetical protein I2I05_20955 [Hymenobacter sp. BT683]|uniref:DUF3408 domain-containing protein n=1 Tax=Hymenobacter jeongseonensis TaxID=2791027 RepID=A0ABS0INC7_9BACT|nr:hypothetical protein [Hymenobacter jeongseonensis]MBF9239874.1 hypothetical protein [Hymenobacter jeongseonensis]